MGSESRDMKLLTTLILGLFVIGLVTCQRGRGRRGPRCADGTRPQCPDGNKPDRQTKLCSNNASPTCSDGSSFTFRGPCNDQSFPSCSSGSLQCPDGTTADTSGASLDALTDPLQAAEMEQFLEEEEGVGEEGAEF